MIEETNQAHQYNSNKGIEMKTEISRHTSLSKSKTACLAILMLILGVSIPCMLLRGQTRTEEKNIWTKRFGIDIDQVKEVKLSIAKKLLERIDLRTSSKVDMSGARLYQSRSREFGELRLMTVPVTTFDDATLGIVVSKNGIVRGVAAWNHSGIDADKTGAWDRFFRQFRDRQIVSSAQLDAPFDPDEYWKQVVSDQSATGKLRSALYEHRILMRDNSYLVHGVRVAIEEQGVVPDADWLASYIPRYERMIEVSTEFEPAVGAEAVVKYQTMAKSGLESIRLAVAASKNGSKKDVNAAIKRATTCAQCHSRRNHSWDNIQGKLTDHGIRSDLFRVSMDIWSIPDEADNSQKFADHIHAALIALGDSN